MTNREMMKYYHKCINGEWCESTFKEFIDKTFATYVDNQSNALISKDRIVENIGQICNILDPFITHDATIASAEIKNIVIVAIMNGGYKYASILSNMLDELDSITVMDVQLISAKSYSGVKQKDVLIEEIYINSDSLSAADAVILVDDIYDTGNTLKTVEQYLLQNYVNDGNLYNVVMLRKDKNYDMTKDDGSCIVCVDNKEVSVKCPLITGHSIPDRWVYGFGLDLFGQYRNLDYVKAVDRSFFE